MTNLQTVIPVTAGRIKTKEEMASFRYDHTLVAQK